MNIDEKIFPKIITSTNMILVERLTKGRCELFDLKIFRVITSEYAILIIPSIEYKAMNEILPSRYSVILDLADATIDEVKSKITQLQIGEAHG